MNYSCESVDIRLSIQWELHISQDLIQVIYYRQLRSLHKITST